MINQVVIVGRLVNNPTTFREDEFTKEYTKITVAVPRSYKNMDGEYETDFVDVSLYNTIATNTIEHCKKGDVIGVKGRLQQKNNRTIEVVAEKITFLSSGNREDRSE